MKLGASLGALADGRFAWFFTARTVSYLGSAMVPVALAFAVLHIDTSAGALAKVLGVRTLMMVIFLLIGGVISDRFSRITVMQIGHALTFLTQGLAAVMIISGHATLNQLIVIEGINGAVSAFTMPAMVGIVPLVVRRPQLQQANALLSFSRSGLGILGPALAGILVVTVGPGWALAIDALTYVVAIVCLSRVRIDHEPKTSDGPKASMMSELREGWGEFVSRQWLWVIVLTFGLLNAIHIGVVGVIGPLVAKTHPAIGEAGWGIILSAEAIGTVLMTLVMLKLKLKHPLRTGMIAMMIIAVPMALLGLAPAIVPLVIGFALAGAAVEVFGVGWNTAMHEHIPVTVLSRVSSYDALGSFVAMPIGTFVYGWLAMSVDLSDLLVISAIVYAAVAALALLSPSVRNLGHEPDEPHESTADGSGAGADDGPGLVEETASEELVVPGAFPAVPDDVTGAAASGSDQAGGRSAASPT